MPLARSSSTASPLSSLKTTSGLTTTESSSDSSRSVMRNSRMARASEQIEILHTFLIAGDTTLAPRRPQDPARRRMAQQRLDERTVMIERGRALDDGHDAVG